MKPSVISIIGGTGKMGRVFADAFRDEGVEVIQSGRRTQISNVEAAKRGDIVIVCIPIRDTKRVIAEIASFVRRDAMFTDFTSVKVGPCLEMVKSSASEVVGGHPLFGPLADFENQNFILCPERTGKYYEWYKNFLKKLGMKVVEMSNEEHDKNMAVIQCLTNISNLSFGRALQKLDFDLGIAKKISSPVYLMRVYGVGRVLSQDKELYSDIQMENPYSGEMAKCYLESVEELSRSILDGDKKSFEDVFEDSKEYFGDFLKESVEVTNKMIKSMGEQDGVE